MLALRPHAAPPLPVAQQLLGAVFGPGAVTVGTGLLQSVEAQGAHRGVPMRARLAMQQTQRSGIQPFTTIDAEIELDVAIYPGGAAWPYPAYEPHAPFVIAPIDDIALVGAPRALLTALTTAPIATRLAESGINRLSLGADAKRDGSRFGGVHLVVEGWPQDHASLVFLLDTVAAIAAEARRVLDEAGAKQELVGGRHHEVVTYLGERERSRSAALKVVLAIVAVIGVLTVLGLAAFSFWLMRRR